MSSTIYKTFGIIALFVGLIFLVLRLGPGQDGQGVNKKKSTQASANSDTASTLLYPKPLPGIEGLTYDSLVAKRGGIAFVKSEDIASKFRLMVRKRNALQARLQKSEKEFEAEATRFRKEVKDFQRNGAAMGESQRASTEQMLARKEQNLVQMRESIMQELSKSESMVDQELRGLLDKEFELFSKARGYRFLMARQVGSGLLYGDSMVDVTDQLIDYLNARYP